MGTNGQKEQDKIYFILVLKAGKITYTKDGQSRRHILPHLCKITLIYTNG